MSQTVNPLGSFNPMYYNAALLTNKLQPRILPSRGIGPEYGRVLGGLFINIVLARIPDFAPSSSAQNWP
jgi:hypothetical protein